MLDGFPGYNLLAELLHGVLLVHRHAEGEHN